MLFAEENIIPARDETSDSFIPPFTHIIAGTVYTPWFFQNGQNHNHNYQQYQSQNHINGIKETNIKNNE